MDEHTSHELAYKKGYDKGYADALRWIPASAPPPDDTEDQWVIYDSGTGYGYTMGYFDGVRWLSSITGFQLPVVGWMPLPTPPKGE